MGIAALDHLVLTVRAIEATCRFCTAVLGFRRQMFGGGRTALTFGRQKINLHEAEHEFEPETRHPTPGSADLCFLTSSPIEDVVAHLSLIGIAVEEGPVARTSATGPITSVYIRDPDGNLVEITRPA